MHKIIWAISVLIIAGGSAWMIANPKPGQTILQPHDLPLVESVTDGRRTASIDHDRWCQAFAAVGLPDPPAVAGGDPVPLRNLADAVIQWSATRSAADLGNIGRIFLAIEEHAAGATHFALAAHMEPQNPTWHYLLGAECQSLGLNDQAQDALEEAARLEPAFPTTYARLGSLRLLRDDLGGAEAAFLRYIDLRPTVSLGHRGLGEIALRKGNPEAAINDFTNAIQATPNDFIAHRHLARALAAAGRAEEARQAAQEAESMPIYSGWLSFDERLREAHSLANTQRHIENSIRTAMTAGDLAQLDVLMQEVLQRRPEDAEMRGRYAAVCASQGRYDEASAQIARAVEEDPDLAALRLTQAEIAMNLKDYDTASEALDRLIELEPQGARGYNLRGRVHFVRGNASAAVDDLETSIELGGPEPDLRFAIATILARSGNSSGAIAQLNRVFELRPDHPQAQQLMRQLADQG